MYYQLKKLERKGRKMKLKNVKTMIEYNGDMYTPEELQEHLGVTGDFEVNLRDEDDTWFGLALQTLRDKLGDQ
jgi:hypothetical protein